MKKLMLVFFILSSCSSKNLNTNAKNVRIVTETPPASCKFIKQVTGSQGNWFTGSLTSNRALEEGAMNDLINKANKSGADTVHLLTNRAGMTGSNGSFSQTNVTLTGVAYKCY